MTMPIGHIVEYWIHDASGDLVCREGREWRAVRREIAEAQANPTPKGENGLVSVERVERHFYWRNHKGEPDGDFDNEYETIWTHPDWDDMDMEWKE
jgi:hypothetical protein|tara:strand:- start:43 stop:330 length:288 start_codon:yes stop_codon:yes gene_type:complete